MNVMLLLDSFVRVNQKYYPQILLEEWKYVVKKKNTINAIREELNLDESDDDESDEKKSWKLKLYLF